MKLRLRFPTLPSALAHRSHTAFKTAAVASWITPFSGPNCAGRHSTLHLTKGTGRKVCTSQFQVLNMGMEFKHKVKKVKLELGFYLNMTIIQSRPQNLLGNIFKVC